MSAKPHIAKHNGRWAVWVERGRGRPNMVPDNTFKGAAIGARWLREQASKHLWPFR